MNQSRHSNGTGLPSRAPIGLSVYSRLEHIVSTVNALKKNTLAAESELFIFSDGPKPGDESKVVAVRQYLQGIDGFRCVSIVERQENSRVKNNRDGHRSLLDKFGRMIWLEEDIVTAPGFLEYMNQALDFYKQDENIFSITGYCPPIIMPTGLKNDVFVLKRFNAWGFATWKRIYDKIELNLNKMKGYLNLNNPEFVSVLMEYGMDIPTMLVKELNGTIDALDVKIMYQQVLNNWYTIYPKKSLVQNIGHDGSGIHCGKTERFHHKELWDKKDEFQFSKTYSPSPKIIAENRKFRFELNEFSTKMVVDGVIQKIKKKNIKSISLWGANNISEILVPYLIGKRINIRFIIDRKAEIKEYLFCGIRVVSISKALASRETNFLLCTIDHIDSMKEILKRKAVCGFDQFNILEIV